MGLNESWDENSETEHFVWLDSKGVTEAQLKACGELWAIWRNEITHNGPLELTQGRLVKAASGEDVAVYCLVRNSDTIMCFGHHENNLHLVLIGPFNNDDVKTKVNERIGRWIIKGVTVIR